MAFQPPALPRSLRYKSLRPVEEPTNTDIGEVSLAVDAGLRSLQETPQPDPPVTAAVLGDFAICQWRMIQDHARRL
ncbi:hypothetical protein M407DRAFT_244303, partial [Tulasnella calospora MUT 4182]